MSQPDYDFLDTEAPEDAPAVEVTPSAATVETPPETVAPVVPTTTPQEPQQVPLAAVMEERKKRQERERELADARQRIAEFERRNAEPPPNFFEAPEHAVQRIVGPQLLAMSEAMVREQFADYDELLAEFEQAAQTNPYLIAELRASANPPLFAYKQAKAMRERKAMEDPAAVRKQIEAEVRAQFEAEYAAKEAARAAAAAAIPPDISNARATKDQGGPVDDESLDSILASRHKR